jgi:uncharacterized protein YecE (DUF72 family)
MGEILVATSGYSYEDWVGPVYPPGTDRRDFLPLYAQRFAFTELNFSYYREPTAEGLRQITAKVPNSFRFVIKAHKLLTHERTAGWERGAERFLQATEGFNDGEHPGQTPGPSPDPPTGAARTRPGVPAGDRLLGILLQFPYSFHYDDTNRRYLASVTDALKPVRLFAEFRNDEWDKPSVWGEMEKRGIGLVIPDLPRLDRLPRSAPRLTSPFGYIRFHGRNAANWWSGTNVTRYDYRYTTTELQDWVEPVGEMAGMAEAVIIAFNNHFAGQAVENAEELMRLLGLTA